MTAQREQALRIERRPPDAAVLWIDVPGESANLLKPGFDEEMERALGELEGDRAVACVVLASGKPENFSAGADVRLLADIESATDAERFSRSAQRMMDRLASFPRPVVAAVHGACLGGGLELALACRQRVASDHEKTRLGLPEVKLGLIPGSGGTQRLPRLIGLEAAVDLIAAGKEISADRALALGLVDEVVHPAILMDVGIERARQLVREPEAEGMADRARRAIGNVAKVEGWKALLLEDNPAGRKLLFSQARKQVLSRTHGNYPAPLRALEAVRRGIADGMEAGLRAEAEAFGEVAVSPESRSLVELFLAREALKEEQEGNTDAREVRKVGVLGAGLMGGGIAYVTAVEARLPVRLKDVDHDTIRRGFRSIHTALHEHAEKERMPEPEREEILHLIRPTTDYTGFRRAEVVIEAVVEDLELKHKVLKELEPHVAPETIFATNTSSIPIRDIAAASPHPERVVGMHYFSPAERVPLLEVVACDRTASWVVATCVSLRRRQGKTVIVVNDGAGFYTTRVLAPYLAEAAHLLLEGVPIERIDSALVEFGFPVGPIRLLDEVGIDVAQKIGEILHHAFGERMSPPGVLERMVHDDRLGKKNGRGFYRYRQGGDGSFERLDEEVDGSVYDLLDLKPESAAEPEEIALRCTLAFVNEAARCYADGILHSASDGDVGAVFGLGFPPFLGGPFRFIDRRGPGEVVALLERFRDRLGERFEPVPLLRTLAERGVGFHTEAAPPPGAGTRPAASTPTPAHEE